HARTRPGFRAAPTGPPVVSIGSTGALAAGLHIEARASVHSLSESQTPADADAQLRQLHARPVSQEPGPGVGSTSPCRALSSSSIVRLLSVSQNLGRVRLARKCVRTVLAAKRRNRPHPRSRPSIAAKDENVPLAHVRNLLPLSTPTNPHMGAQQHSPGSG